MMTNQQESIKEFLTLSPTPTYALYLRWCGFHGIVPVSQEEFDKIKKVSL